MARRFMKQYGTRLIVPLYMVFYLASFYFLEDRGFYRLNVIHSSVDYSIPFCEYFIIPYILWFFYIALTVYWFMFKNKNEKEYLQLIINLGIGMTAFLFISWIYPNGHFLRPIYFPRDNIFTDMVRMLYRADTATNILPSIHVYNSVAAFIAIVRCKKLRKRPVVIGGTFVLTVSIILATVFLKQHTVIDIVMAFVMNFLVYLIVYFPDDHRAFVRRSAAVHLGNL